MFDAQSEYLIMKRVLECKLDFPSNFPPVAQDLIEKLLVKDPQKRIGYDEIKNHPFFTGIDFKKIHECIPPPLVPIESEKEIKEVSFHDVFEKDEKVVFSCLILKKKSLMIKTKQIIITNTRILLANPLKKLITHEIVWDESVNIVKKNENEINLSGGKENWLIEDLKDSEKLFKKLIDFKKAYQ